MDLEAELACARQIVCSNRLPCARRVFRNVPFAYCKRVGAPSSTPFLSRDSS